MADQGATLLTEISRELLNDNHFDLEAWLHEEMTLMHGPEDEANKIRLQRAETKIASLEAKIKRLKAEIVRRRRKAI